MHWPTIANALLLGGLPIISQARAAGSGTEALNGRQQDVVTWDDYSLMLNGERLMVFSGEIHPFRLPVPGLWLDVLQKIKAAGYNCVSIYIDWHLLEAERGHFRAQGNFALEPFFAAAQEAGLYVIARPGPYINAEVAGGGFPGWLTRVRGALRSSEGGYLEATDLYTRKVGEMIAAAQVTNGGPVLLFQPENEYQNALEGYVFPDYEYWDRVVKQYRDAGVTVPYINNEAHMYGYITAHTNASVDIYGHDAYPLGFDCDNPTVWPEDGLATDWLATNNELAPDTPYTIPEFQGGGFQHWGGNGFENCALLLNMEFERVVYKNNYAVGATIFNIYMIYGGTNYGNLGHAEGYTSYDYGAQITEERLLWREKYSEVKLQANFFHVSPAYLEADRHNASLAFTDNEAVTVTPATTDTTKFYIVRHTRYDTTDPAPYRLTVNTANRGDIEIPQLGGALVLNRRDSKIHVSDYPVGDYNLLYSSAEVFTWKQYDDKTCLVLYGGPNEHHELAVERRSSGDEAVVEVGEAKIQRAEDGDYDIVSWDTSDDVKDRKVVKLGELYIYLLNRNEAYNFWVPPTRSSYTTSDIILKAGYLVRTAQVDGKTLSIVGDVNATTPIEIIGGAPAGLETLTFNGRALDFEQSPRGVVTATVEFSPPDLSLPELDDLDWRALDSLPELSPDYDDSKWTDADLETSPNDKFPITTPTSLYGGDYGYHTGSVLFRGHFAANGKESSLNLTAQGGQAFGFSVWLDDVFLASCIGEAELYNGTVTASLPALSPGSKHVITVVVDHMGLNGNYVIGEDTLKAPRGILSYGLSSHDASDITWKVTGNLGGEAYKDLIRGPLNEGAMFAERQGYHLPSPPSGDWEQGKPTRALGKPGINFYTASFDLDLPENYDIPLSISFSQGNGTSAYRVQFFVNGYQFGKYVPHIGPQSRYPVPEGILNYHGENTLALTVWGMEEGAELGGLKWDIGMVSETGYGGIKLSEAPEWEEREGAY